MLKAALAFIDFLAAVYVFPIRLMMPFLRFKDDTFLNRIIQLPFLVYLVPWALYHFNVRKRCFIEVVDLIDPAEAERIRAHERYEQYILQIAEEARARRRRQVVKESVNWMKDGF